MLFADYARGCVLRFKGNGNNFDFSQPHIVMDGRFVLPIYIYIYIYILYYCTVFSFLAYASYNCS